MSSRLAKRGAYVDSQELVPVIYCLSSYIVMHLPCSSYILCTFWVYSSECTVQVLMTAKMVRVRDYCVRSMTTRRTNADHCCNIIL